MPPTPSLRVHLPGEAGVCDIPSLILVKDARADLTIPPTKGWPDVPFTPATSAVPDQDDTRKLVLSNSRAIGSSVRYGDFGSGGECVEQGEAA